MLALAILAASGSAGAASLLMTILDYNLNHIGLVFQITAWCFICRNFGMSCSHLRNVEAAEERRRADKAASIQREINGVKQIKV